MIQIRKLKLDNLKGKENSKFAFEFQNFIKTKINIRDWFSIFRKIETRWKDLFFKDNLVDLTDQISNLAKKKSRKKWTQNSFFNFYWNSKFGFEICFSIFTFRPMDWWWLQRLWNVILSILLVGPNVLTIKINHSSKFLVSALLKFSWGSYRIPI